MQIHYSNHFDRLFLSISSEEPAALFQGGPFPQRSGSDMFDNAIRSAVKGAFDALLQRSGVLWNEFHDTMNYPIQIFTGFTFKAEG